jgi:aminopeptidase N
LHGDVIELDEATKRIAFMNVPERPVLSINRGFSAPIKLESDLGDDDLAFLAAHDADAFNRWQALQTIAMRLLIANVGVIRQSRPAQSDDRLIRALAALLEDESLEHAFVALALAPPDEGDIAREIGRDIDPDAIWRARHALRIDIGLRLKSALSTLYERLAVGGGYAPDAAGAGRRALRNVALDLMAAPGEAEDIARAARQYAQADNMTDRFAALATLSQHDGEARERAFDDFYRRYREDALVIDKWLSLQAMSPRADTLDRVRALVRHPAFSMTNPNRVRSLIGAFAHSNTTQFNRADGAGYDFVADVIAGLDPKNPQVAARMATAFRSWRTMEAGRRARAEAALRRVQRAPGLSRDVADIVERALG